MSITTGSDIHQCPKSERLVGPSKCVRSTPRTFTQAQAQSVGIRTDRYGDESWPYGPNICGQGRNELVAWALENHYKLAEPRNRCLHWLIGQARRCGALQKTSHDGRVDLGWLRSGLFDHVTCWTRDRKPALILAQPYSVDDQAVATVIEQWPVDVVVVPHSPWYRYGTRGVFVTPRPS